MRFQSKQEARAWAVGLRGKFSDDKIKDDSKRLAAHLAAFLRAIAPPQVFMFAALNHEPNILSLAADYQNPVYGLPITRERLFMDFFRYRAGDPLKQGTFGIPVPENPNEVITPCSNDVMLIPAVALTKVGSRLGHGKGYYDIYLSSLKNKPTLVGVCWEELICEKNTWPEDAHDVRLDHICTQTGICKMIA